MVESASGTETYLMKESSKRKPSARITAGSRIMVNAIFSAMASSLTIKCHFRLRLLTILLRLHMPKDIIFKSRLAAIQTTFTPNKEGLLIKHQLHINIILSTAHHMVAQLMAARPTRLQVVRHMAVTETPSLRAPQKKLIFVIKIG